MELKDFFAQNPKAAIAFSGGVDSAYLLYAAKSCGADVKAYYVKSPFQPAFELEDAERLARELAADMEIIYLNVLENEQIASNPPRRCYYCKRAIMSAIMKKAAADGYGLLLDGSNASDDAADRPGMQALAELSVCSPLRECGLTKTMIRSLSKEAGLFTHEKAAYACLATRIPSGEAITIDKLEATERAEEFLNSLGFENFRVRLFNGSARLQLRAADMTKALAMRQTITDELTKYYASVMLDLEARDEQ